MPDGCPPFYPRPPDASASCLRRIAVLLLSLLFVSTAHANLTINRYVNANDIVVTNGQDRFSTLNWTNNGLTNISAVSVRVVLSSNPTNEMVVGETAAYLSYNIGAANGVTNAVVYTNNLTNEATSLDATFSVTNSFTSPGGINEWDLTIANNAGNAAPAIFNYWRLILTGGAVTNGTIEAGAQGIISATDGYVVEATVSAGTGTGSNAVTATVTNNQSLNFNGGLTGSGDLAKTGAGTLSVGGNSSGFSGTFALNEGTADIKSTTALGTGRLVQSNGSSTVIFSAGGTIANSMSLYNVLFANGGNTLSGTITNNGTTYNVASSTANTISGTLVGTGGMTKAGDGTLTLSGDNSFSGVLTVAQGKLNIGTINNALANGVLGNSTNAVVLGSSGQTGFLHYTGVADGSSDKTFTAASGGTAGIEVSNASTVLTLSGAIGGSGNVQKGGAGILALSGNNTFSGTLSVHDGTLQIGTINNASANGVLGNSASAVELGKTNTSNTSTLLYTGSTASSTKAFTLVSETNAAAVINVSNSATALTLSGAIGGVGRLEKSGAGTLVLAANNTYAGGTTLSTGTLSVTHANALGTGYLTQSSSSSLLEIGVGGSVANSMSVYNVKFSNGGNTLSGTITQNNTTYDVNAGQTNTLSGHLTGGGTVTLIGGGVLDITGTTNNYTGNTVISNGTIRVSTLNNTNTTGPLGVNNNVTLAGANASNSIIDYTGGNVTTDRSFVASGVAASGEGGTLHISNSSSVVTLTGSASGTGKMIVDGGTLVLSNATTANSFAPTSIQVNSNTVLEIAADNQIGDSTGLILNGGTFRVGTSETQFSENLGTLTLTASSTIDLGSWTGGTKPRQIVFDNSSGITWTGTLTITNWQGVAQQSSDVAEILFGVGGLDSTQLGQVYWANQNINGGQLIGGGELVPVPEPRVYAAAVALLAVVGWRERKRLRQLLSKSLRHGLAP